MARIYRCSISKIKFIGLLVYFFLVNALGSPVVIQKPIQFDQQRVELTQQYRNLHYGIDTRSIVIVPQMIVLHWTATKTLQAAFDLFYPPLLTGRKDIKADSLLNVSAQFLVDRDGTIYQLMPDNWMARHVIGLNNIAIGIENVGGENNQSNLTEAQVASNVFLIRYLIKQYPTIHYLIGHFEYQEFKNSPLWQEKQPNYITQKFDPGSEFMQKVRERITDLSLKGPP